MGYVGTGDEEDEAENESKGHANEVRDYGKTAIFWGPIACFRSAALPIAVPTSGPLPYPTIQLPNHPTT